MIVTYLFGCNTAPAKLKGSFVASTKSITCCATHPLHYATQLRTTCLQGRSKVSFLDTFPSYKLGHLVPHGAMPDIRWDLDRSEAEDPDEMSAGASEGADVAVHPGNEAYEASASTVTNFVNDH